MTPIVLLIVALAAIGAGACILYIRLADARQTRAAAAALELERANQQIRGHTIDFVGVEGARHQHGLVPLQTELADNERRLHELDEELAALPEPEWSGPALAIRVLAMTLGSILFVLGLLLNISTFRALIGPNTGFGTATAVLIGVFASVLELVLAAVIAHLVANREPRLPSWHIRLWGAFAAMAVILLMVWTYAPARSANAIGPTISDLQLQAQQAKAPGADPLVAAAADKKLADETERLHEAQTADQMQAVLLPVGQMLTFELAWGGAQALTAHARRRRLLRARETLRAEGGEMEGRIRAADTGAIHALFQRLFQAGVPDIARTVAEANTRNAAPRGLPSPPPGSHRDAPPPADTPIDLDAPHRPPDDTGWDLSR